MVNVKMGSDFRDSIWRSVTLRSDELSDGLERIDFVGAGVMEWNPTKDTAQSFAEILSGQVQPTRSLTWRLVASKFGIVRSVPPSESRSDGRNVANT